MTERSDGFKSNEEGVVVSEGSGQSLPVNCAQRLVDSQLAAQECLGSNTTDQEPSASDGTGAAK